jgi:hypothetical protein
VNEIETSSPPVIHKCDTVNCPRIAEFYAAWPGQPLKFCEPCLERAKRIAEMMGFALPCGRIKQEEPRP